MTALDQQSQAARKQAVARLGEELPVFCEKCGYSLHGLPQIKCHLCEILHFACPECGHHQPINTLRPAVQRFLGRLRAFGLVAIVFFKLNYFGWLAFAWFAMGIEWLYVYRGRPNGTYVLELRSLNIEMLVCFVLLAIPYAIVGRMLLLRWRRGIIVAWVLALQVWALVTFGAWFRANIDLGRAMTVEPLWNSTDYYHLGGWTCITIAVAGTLAWPLWSAIVWAFLPRNTAQMLLDWQRSQSNRTTAGLGRT
jgi:hypothetical protein